MNLYFSKNYSNFEAFYQDAFRWNLEFRKLSKGHFDAHIGLIDIGDIQVGEINLDSRIEQEGVSPRGFRTFVIPADNKQSFKWLNHAVSSRDLLIFSEQGDLEAVSSDNFHHYMISIHENLLKEIIRQNGLSTLEKKLNNSEQVIQLNMGYFVNIQTFLQVIFRKLEARPYLVDSASFQFYLRDKLPRMMLGFLDTKDYNYKSPPGRKRDLILEKCKGYLHGNKLRDVSVSKLTEALDVSERTLQYAFLEKYGVTPKSYITALKMSEVRKTFQDPSNKEFINNVAKRVGFNHAGQFSIDYKKLFEESPSETVQRIRVQTARNSRIIH